MNSELDYDGTGAAAAATTAAREVRYSRSYRAPLNDKYEPQKSCFVVLTDAHGDLREAEVAISSVGVGGGEYFFLSASVLKFSFINACRALSIDSCCLEQTLHRGAVSSRAAGFPGLRVH
jgi:microcompartment protein CcmK/EutM